MQTNELATETIPGKQFARQERKFNSLLFLAHIDVSEIEPEREREKQEKN